MQLKGNKKALMMDTFCFLILKGIGRHCKDRMLLMLMLPTPRMLQQSRDSMCALFICFSRLKKNQTKKYSAI